MASSSSTALHSYKFVDIGANLLDERFTQGSYRGKVRHEPDFDQVVERASAIGMKHLVLTAGTLKESRSAVEKVRQLRQTNQTEVQLYCTVGVHPTRCNEFLESPQEHLQELLEILNDGLNDNTVAAIGEFGLDYDRLEFCPKEVQLQYFQAQLDILASCHTKVPLFLHNRNVGTDLLNLLKEHRDKWTRGVVHSFDDSAELAAQFVELGLFIGLNGCSLKTEENLQVVQTIPLDHILLETDCPYCDVRQTHAGFKHVQTTFPVKPEKKFQPGMGIKGRNEPCNIIQVAEVVAGVRNMPVEELVQACYANSLRLYGWHE